MRLGTYYKVALLKAYIQETPTQVFSCEYCEIFKKTYLEEHLPTAASVLRISNSYLTFADNECLIQKFKTSVILMSIF